MPRGKQQTRQQQQQTERNKPVHVARIGAVRAQVWANETEYGVAYSITVDRLYKTSDGQWSQTHSFGRDDALAVQKAIDWAHTWIVRRENQEAEDRRQQGAR